MTAKADLSERDICSKYISPALERAGWDMERQVREEVYFTDGRIYVKGNSSGRGKGKRADYILYYKSNIPVGIIEAKSNKHLVSAGIQQGAEYAAILDIPSVFSSNGDAFQERDLSHIDRYIEREIPLDQFPSPAELWERYKRYKGIQTEEEARIIGQDYFSDGSDRTARYYQQIAINRTVEAVAKGQKRILLTMATGTGKTYTAFQIIHRLMKAGVKKRALFLADRNVLIDQARRRDFNPFKDYMTVIRHKKIDPAYQVHLALYQGIIDENGQHAYLQVRPSFFDLVIIDECHRGSASEDSAWRQILDYFSDATHIGLTATPKETETVSSTEYFGAPIYTYSLRQGIQDGFLAPYKVVRVGMNVDLEGWRPEAGKLDKDGKPVEDRIYNTRDFDKTLAIEERTRTVANRITEYLRQTGRKDKTIVFCVDVEHADRLRTALANANGDLMAKNRKFVMRITGDDEEGKRELDNFIDPKEPYPVIATTSKLMTTGVDAQTCKLIVLDSVINSMTEFKQIIGRGTRINEDYGKTFFTILDFRNVTKLFADPEFDGEPVQIKEVGEDEDFPDPEEDDDEPIIDEDGEEVTIYPGGNAGIVGGGEIIEEPEAKVYVNGVNVAILNERIQYLDADGKLITAELKDYTRQKVLAQFPTLGDFLSKWNSATRKRALIKELAEQGIIYENLREVINKEMDIFDMICHAAFDRPPLTRAERAKQVRKRDVFSRYGEQARKVLDALLDKYADKGIENMEDMKILKATPFTKLGTPVEIVNWFGGRDEYQEALVKLEQEIYKEAA